MMPDWCDESHQQIVDCRKRERTFSAWDASLLSHKANKEGK